MNAIPLPDLHIHTAMSADAEGDVERFATRAVQLGIPAIGFSEHYDFNPIDRSYGYFDYDAANREIETLRNKYDDDIEILFGVEITYETPFLNEIVNGLLGKKFDYVIGSIHYVNPVMISERSSVTEYEKRNAADIYGAYFREMLRMLGSGLIDIVGHFDLCKRYGVQVYGPFSEKQVPDKLVEKCLGKMIDENIALEINSSGYRQLPKEPYPGEAIIRRYLEMGGKLIMTGSDAHTPDQLGAGLNEEEKLLMGLGVESAYIYRERKPYSFGI
ncbi:MAG: histidinol-phosphatase [bacterium]|nr:histidinol-phosphatase [bacterium]